MLVTLEVIRLEWMDFLTILVFTFAIVMLVAGLFTAYFGSGKSRKVGVALLVIGLLVGFIWAWLVGWSEISPFYEVEAWDVMRNALFNIVAAVIGALVAVGIFLVAVMKS
jgi:fatty acid desaturase